MSVVDIELIPATTSQATSRSFNTIGPRTIIAGPLLGDGEGVKIQVTHDGVIWQDFYLNGVLQELLPKHTMITILGPGLFRVIKSVTASPVSVVYWISESDA